MIFRYELLWALSGLFSSMRIVIYLIILGCVHSTIRVGTLKRVTILLDDHLYRQLVGFSAEISKARIEKINLSSAIRELLERQLEKEETEELAATITR